MTVRLDSASKRAAARIGGVLKDKWKLDALIGVGGMAAVYAATHRNKKRAAIKMLHPELSLDHVMRERFLREGYAANSVDHVGAVRVDDDDVAEDGCAYIVMELLHGETIDARWERKEHRLPPGEVLSIVDQLLDTLGAAHAKGIIHRDIKPENLFLTRAGVVKVLDFGIARLHELTGSKTSTETGNTMGTPAYMAPEQARGRWEDVDTRTDLWAVGATMFTLLTGEYVHNGETVNETIALAVTQHARSVAELRPDLHPALVEVVDRALAYDKAARWPDAASMQEVVRRAYLAVQGEDVSHAPQLMVPELSRIPSIVIQDGPSSTDSLSASARARSRALTTARGVTASGHRTVRRLTMKRKRAVVVSAVGASVLLCLLLWMLSSRAPDPGLAAASDGTLLPVASTTASAAPPASTDAAPIEPDQVPPQVSVEDLPREKKRKNWGTKPSAPPAGAGTKHTPSTDPFSRRH